MRLHIVNTDGVGQHTQVVDTATGERLDGVQRVDLTITPSGLIVATLVVRVTVDVVVDDPHLETVRV